MAGVDIWNERAVLDAADAELVRRMKIVTLALKGRVQRKLNVGNPTGTRPSRPGEPPRKVTGRLFQSVATQVRREGTAIIGAVGTNVVYARRLEFGFVGTDALGRNIAQAPRPAWRPVLVEARQEILGILGRGIL